MKKFNKTVLAATIAMLLSPTAHAVEIAKGATGAAAQIVDGKEVVIGQTYKIGEMPSETAVKVLPSSDMPVNLQGLNMDSVAKVEFDSKTLSAAQKDDVVKLDFLGVPKDAKVMNNVTHDNGDHSMVASTGNGDRTVLTFGVDGSVVGTANVDGHVYSVSTDENKNVWMVDNTTSGATQPSFEHDTLGTTLGAGTSKTVKDVVTTNYATPVANVTNYTAADIPIAQAAIVTAAANLAKQQANLVLAQNSLATAIAAPTTSLNYAYNIAAFTRYVNTYTTAINVAQVTLNNAKALLVRINNVLANVTTATQPISTLSLLIYVADSIPSSSTVVNNLVAVTNQSYVDSGIQMRVIATKVVTITDPTPTSETSALSYLKAGQLAFSTVAADKLASKADLVSFIHPLKIAQGMCGLAYLNGGYGSDFSKMNVYSVVSYGIDGAYFCNSWALAHELGHNMGMVHDVAHSGSVIGHYPDSYGYGVTNLYGDIMSYYPAVGVFSNPNKYWMNKQQYAFGELGKANVTRGLNLIAPQASLFHTLVR